VFVADLNKSKVLKSMSLGLGIYSMSKALAQRHSITSLGKIFTTVANAFLPFTTHNKAVCRGKKA
jgi:hypothetical protein